MDLDPLDILKYWPEDFPPMEREAFEFALSVANGAANFDIPVENPEIKGATLVDEATAEEQRISFTDRPMNRAMLASREHFGDDTDGYMNFVMRFLALIKVGQVGSREATVDAEARAPPATEAEVAHVIKGTLVQG